MGPSSANSSFEDDENGISLQSTPLEPTTLSPADDNATTADTTPSNPSNDTTTPTPPSCKDLVKASCEKCTGVEECEYLTSETTGLSICQEAGLPLPPVAEANWRVYYNTSECSGGGEIPGANTTTTTTTSTTSTTTAPPPSNRNHFDGWSFFGGILLTLGLAAIGLVGFKYYKLRSGTGGNYGRF